MREISPSSACSRLCSKVAESALHWECRAARTRSIAIWGMGASPEVPCDESLAGYRANGIHPAFTVAAVVPGDAQFIDGHAMVLFGRSDGRGERNTYVFADVFLGGGEVLRKPAVSLGNHVPLSLLSAFR